MTQPVTRLGLIGDVHAEHERLARAIELLADGSRFDCSDARKTGVVERIPTGLKYPDPQEQEELMHLIFLHGVPGVGKRTIARELAKELAFSFLDFQNLTHLLGPVFGYSSATFGEIRNAAYKQTMDAALALPDDDGLIASFMYDQFVDLDQYAAFIQTAKDSGGIGLFVGLTCDTDELKARMEDPNRRSSTATAVELMEDDFNNMMPENLDLPGPSITINTTGETPETTVQNILATLPDDMKGNISF